MLMCMNHSLNPITSSYICAKYVQSSALLTTRLTDFLTRADKTSEIKSTVHQPDIKLALRRIIPLLQRVRYICYITWGVLTTTPHSLEESTSNARLRRKPLVTLNASP